jgi:hypothetical protein
MKSHDGFGSSADARNSGGNFGSKNKSNKSGVGDAKKSLVGHDDVCGYYGKKGALVPWVSKEEARWRGPGMEIVEQWVFDMGATNHMIGAKHLFIELDTQIYGQVKFGDASVTKIEGWGNIIIVYNSRDHHTLTGAYYILRLKTSILSISQLDENGCRISIHHGVLRIFDQADRLLAKVNRLASRLYYLELQVGQPICLTTHIRGGLVVARPIQASQFRVIVEACSPEHGAWAATARSSWSSAWWMLGEETYMCIIPGASVTVSQLNIGPCPWWLVWASVSSNLLWQEVLPTASRWHVMIHVAMIII